MLFFAPANVAAIRKHIKPNPLEVGFLLSPQYSMNKYRDYLDCHAYGIDNQCFVQAAAFDFTAFLAFLKRVKADYPTRLCRFVVVPDTVADAEATRRQWIRYAPSIRRLGFPLAYVAQDGLTQLPRVKFDALFIGGSTEYKLSQTVVKLVRQAKARGLWVHMGRVNTLTRLTHAYLIGCDSVDGSSVAMEPRKIKAFVNHIQWLRRQQRMIA